MESGGVSSLNHTSSNLSWKHRLVGDEIEEVVQQAQTLIRRPIIGRPQPRLYRAPVRRRRREGDFGKSYEMFGMSTARSSMDGSDASSSSALTIVTSATSSCTDQWSPPGGFVEDEEDDGSDFNWSQEDEMLLEPKPEPMDTDTVDLANIAEVKESVAPESPTSVTTPPQMKRPRGRPRKNPKPNLEMMAKVTKGRSKTGCLTCRKRKKKCDETKPGCMNCEKNSVKCEGYPEKTIWKSGKEKAEEARLRRAGTFPLPNIQLPFLINGLETEGDRMFLHHYITRLSIIFTLEGEKDSAFRNIMLPMAQQNVGLMHSILALSSKHIDYSSPYGLAFLRQHPNVDVETLVKRSQFHEDQAFKSLVNQQCDAIVKPSTYGQILCLVLNTLSDPAPSGQHRLHLQHYQKLVQECQPETSESMKFIHEFFQYHIHADELVHLPEADIQYKIHNEEIVHLPVDQVHFVSQSDDFNLPRTVVQPSAVRLLGVFDGLFLYMSKITNIRNAIRQNFEKGIDPIVDYKAYYAAAEIDAGIREWTPVWPKGDPRDAAGLLYRQMMWIYLWRTIYPPQCSSWKLHPHITLAVNDGIALLSSFGPRDPSQTLILAPAFVIGCAAFEPEQREPIRKAIGVVKAYMEYKNTDTALEVLEEVWRLMDQKDERSWDWQSIAHRMGMDFLAT